MPEYYLASNRPQLSERTVTIVYYSSDAAAALELVASEHQAGHQAFARDAMTFDGETEPCSRVVILPDVAPHHRRRLMQSFGGKVEELRDEDQNIGSLGREVVQPIQKRRGRPPKNRSLS